MSECSDGQKGDSESSSAPSTSYLSPALGLPGISLGHQLFKKIPFSFAYVRSRGTCPRNSHVYEDSQSLYGMYSIIPSCTFFIPLKIRCESELLACPAARACGRGGSELVELRQHWRVEPRAVRPGSAEHGARRPGPSTGSGSRLSPLPPLLQCHAVILL